MRIPAPNYTQTPNDLFDHWLPHLGEAELKVLLVIMRKTFGWHKTRDIISISQLSKLTGMKEETVLKAAKSLQKKGIILRQVTGQIGKQVTHYELVISEDSNNSYPSVEQRGPLRLETPLQTEAQKKEQTKETIQKKQQSVCLSVSPKEGVLSCKKTLCSGEIVEIKLDDIFTQAIRRGCHNFLMEEIELAWDVLVAYEDPIRDWWKLFEGIILKNRQKTQGIKQCQQKETKIQQKKNLEDQSSKDKDNSSEKDTSVRILAKYWEERTAKRKSLNL